MESAIITIKNALPLLFRGAIMTLKLWGVAGCISVVTGTVTGILRTQKIRTPIISSVCDVVTFLLRGIPFYVQLLLAYFILPELLNIDLSPFIAATLALGLCSGAYISQIVKSGLNAIPSGEWDAAYVLGYNRTQALHSLMVPRAFRLIIPALLGELDQLLKSTSIISTLGIFELTNAARNIVERDLQPLPIYAAVAVIYLLMSAVFNSLLTKIFIRNTCND